MNEKVSFLCSIISGSVFILAGMVLYRFPPAHINSLYGYRTNRSMRSQLAWDFAQQEGGKQLAISGSVLILISWPFYFITLPTQIDLLLGIGMVILFSVFPIIAVERKLKNKFD